MKSADLYFDFISPFAYLHFHMLNQLPQDLTIRYKPVLFAGLLKHWEHKGPAEIPEKRKFTYRFVQWKAEELGIPLKFPPAHPFNPVKVLRLAVALGSERAVIEAIFNFIWREGSDVNDPSTYIDGELFWGLDSLEMLSRYLSEPDVFENPELRRISELPVGTERKRK